LKSQKMQKSPTSLRYSATSKRHRTPRPLSRREFLIALLGLGGAVGATAGLGVGYLLSDTNPNAASLPTPTSDETRVALFKSAEHPTIILREEWGARASNFDAENEHGFYTLDNPQGWRLYLEDLRLVYTTIIIHHSLLYKDDDLATVKAIQNLHMDSRGWADMGYHFCVGKSGSIYEGRPFTARGTHTEGHNTGTLGICLMGNFVAETPPQAQLDATQQLVNWVALRLDISHLAGHRDFNPRTTCPGDTLYPYLDGIAYAAMLSRGKDGYVAPPEQLITPTPDPNSVAMTSTCSCGCGGSV
jgi:hypothetical protein